MKKLLVNTFPYYYQIFSHEDLPDKISIAIVTSELYLLQGSCFLTFKQPVRLFEKSTVLQIKSRHTHFPKIISL